MIKNDIEVTHHCVLTAYTNIGKELSHCNYVLIMGKRRSWQDGDMDVAKIQKRRQQGLAQTPSKNISGSPDP